MNDLIAICRKAGFRPIDAKEQGGLRVLVFDTAEEAGDAYDVLSNWKPSINNFITISKEDEEDRVFDSTDLGSV